MKPPQPSTEPAAGLSRRKDMRLDAPATLIAGLEGVKGRIALRDISMGGLSIVTSSPIGLRTLQTVTLNFGSIKVGHAAKVLHCRRNPGGGWLVGMAFCGKPMPGSATVAQLFNAILSSAISFS